MTDAEAREGEAPEGPEDEDDFWEDFPEYRGEVRPRKRWVAAVLTMLAPGMGYVYIGHFLKGMLVNLAFLGVLSGFVLSWRLLQFFPLWPAAVLLVGWIGLSLLIILDVLERVGDEPEYVLRATNHPMVYVAVLVFGFQLPVGFTLYIALTHVWMRAWAGNDAMYPGVVEGDLVLVDRMVYTQRDPVRGELILAEEEPDGELFFGRVIGVPGDRIHMEGSLPWVNSDPLTQYLHGTAEELQNLPTARFSSESTLMALIETPHEVKAEEETEPDRWYVIASPAQPDVLPTQPVELESGEIFVLGDNRALPYGPTFERLGGRVIQREQILGAPQFILFSVEPDSERWRWERVGLRLK